MDSVLNSYQYIFKKKKKYLVLLFGLICLAWPVYLCLENNDIEKDVTDYHYPPPGHIIKGFRFEGWNKDVKVISITADRMSIEKKKVGFFSFGLLNVARLEKASVNLSGMSITNGLGAESSAQKFTLKDIFSNDALPALPVRRVASVEMEPVSVQLLDKEAVVTKITADFATIRFKKRDILFQGNVLVKSGSRSLTTGRLSLDPEKAIFSTETHFVLKTPEKEEKGRNLTVDILLKH